MLDLALHHAIACSASAIENISGAGHYGPHSPRLVNQAVSFARDDLQNALTHLNAWAANNAAPVDAEDARI